MIEPPDTAKLVSRVIPETADADLLSLPLRSIADVEQIERVPLEQRLMITNFMRRIDLALAARDPNDIAISYVEDGDVGRTPTEIGFGELRRNIDLTAALLRSRGIARGDAVAVLLPAVPAIYWSLLGAMAAGIVFPVNWMMEPQQILHLLCEARVRAVIALGPTPGFKIWESMMSIAAGLPAEVAVWSVRGPNGEFLPETDLDAAIQSQVETAGRGEISGDDIAAYVHSGGTTGAPKIVKLSHRGLSYRHWTAQLSQKHLVGEVCLHDTPMFHVGGFIGRCLSALASGASMVIPSVIGARDRRYIANYWKFVEKYRITRLSAVPTTLAVLAKMPPQGEDLSSLKPYFGTGSTALPISVRDEFQRVSGVRVLNTYGMTENTASISCDPRDGVSKEGSSGIRFPYTKVRSVMMGTDGTTIRLCGPNEIGMLQISGPGVTPGYVDPAHERGARTDDGWLISGDLGRIDQDGCIFVTGRAKDVIIRSGHNIDPALIEEPLMQSPDVLLAAAVGKPDAYAGELPVAYVQLVPGSRATSSDLTEYLRDRIAERAALPKEIFIVDEIPLTAVGKPLKTQLRQDAAQRTFRSVLSQATGLSLTDGRLVVSVAPHSLLGTMVSITVTCACRQRGGLEARIREVMGQYSIGHDIQWIDEPDMQQIDIDAEPRIGA
jgi:fatty-acyl-CoA synthase